MRRYLVVFSLSSMMLYAESGLLEVIWPKIDKQQLQMQKAYPSNLKEKVAEVTLPVYIPRQYIYNQTMSVVADESYYTVTVHLDKARLMITGDRTYQESVAKADEAFQKMMKSNTVEFVHAEGMMMTDFNRHGVNYTLMVECDQPKSDQRCSDESFLRNLYEELTIVGGKR